MRRSGISDGSSGSHHAVLTVYCLKEVPTEFLSGGYKRLIAAVARVVNKITTPRSRGMRTRVVFKGHTLL